MKELRFLLLIFPFVVMINCGNKIEESSNEKIDQMELIVNYPIVWLFEGKLKLINTLDTITIYHREDETIYEFPAARNDVTIEHVPGTENYLFYKNGNSLGWLLISLYDSSKDRQVSVDTILNNRAVATARFDLSPNVILTKTKDLQDGKVLEEYIARVKDNSLIYDSIYFYFDKKLKIKYSFSPKMDSVKGMKLYKVRLLYNGEFNTEYKVQMPKREFLFEIRQIQDFNRKAIIDLFDNFRRRAKTAS